MKNTFKRVNALTLGWLVPLLLLASCSTKNNGAVKTGNLAGLAVYIPLVGRAMDSVVFENQPIQIKDMQLGYTYPANTDTTGLFSFPGLLESDSYELSTSYSVSDSTRYQVTYKADQVLKGTQLANLTLTAIPDTMQFNTTLLIVTDKNGGLIPGATILGYTSGELAQKDTGYSGFGSTFQLKTSFYGKTLLMGLDPGPFYIRSQFQADTGLISFRSDVDTIVIGRFTRDTVKLK